MLTTHDVAAIEALKVGNEANPMVKFCDKPQHWYLLAQRIVYEFGLIEARPIKIFDLGCGFGYFCYICREVHHEVIGLELANPLILEANRILWNSVVTHDLTGPEPLPPIVRNADLITMFGVNLRQDDGDYWTAEQYATFTADVCSRLKPKGRFVIRPNYPFTWNIDAWQMLISPIATVEQTATTITVRPK